jgi:hypothetical protein
MRLSQANILAYLASSSAMKTEKGFETLSPGVNVIKLFSSLLTTRPNKLECLHLAKTFNSGLTFTGGTGSLPQKEASEMSYN